MFQMKKYTLESGEKSRNIIINFWEWFNKIEVINGIILHNIAIQNMTKIVENTKDMIYNFNIICVSL